MNIKGIEKGIIKILPHHHGDKYSRVSPHRAWRNILILFVVLNIGIVVWSGYVWVSIKSGGVFNSATQGAQDSSTLNRAKLDKIAERFDSEAKHFDDLKLAQPTYVDPSK